MCGQSLSSSKVTSKLDLEDQLNSSLTKALAISTFILDENFRNYPDSVRHGCLWVINDYIENAIHAANKLQSHCKAALYENYGSHN